MSKSESIKDRLARIEAHSEYQTKLLEGLAPLPLSCAARGVELKTLIDANLPHRVQKLENDIGVGKKVLGVFTVVSVTVMTNKYWATLVATLQNAFK